MAKKNYLVSETMRKEDRNIPVFLPTPFLQEYKNLPFFSIFATSQVNTLKLPAAPRFGWTWWGCTGLAKIPRALPTFPFIFPQMPLPFSITPECINKRKRPLSSEYYSDTTAPRGGFCSRRQLRCKEFLNVPVSLELWWG